MVPSTCTCTCICANRGVQLQYSMLPLFPDRSFPRHKMFIQGTCEGKEGRAALFRVLAVYALYNPEVSYCQGNPTHAPVVFFLCLSSQVRWCLMGCVWLIAQVYWKNFIILTVKKIKQCVLSRRLQQHVLWHKHCQRHVLSLCLHDKSFISTKESLSILDPQGTLLKCIYVISWTSFGSRQKVNVHNNEHLFFFL